MVKLIIDHREMRSQLVKELFEREIEIEAKQLEVGDFILSDDVAVEKKTCGDFVTSLIDGRLFQQAREMRANFKKPLYIVEGSVDELFESRNVHANAIRAAMISLALDFQIMILFSSGFKETANLLVLIAKREQEELNKEVPLRGSRRAWDLKEQQQFFLEGLPSVGPALAKRLLEKFKTPKKVINASADKLQKVDKLGEKKAGMIRRVLDEINDKSS